MFSSVDLTENLFYEIGTDELSPEKVLQATITLWIKHMQKKS
jgi:hypothetical protein